MGKSFLGEHRCIGGDEACPRDGFSPFINDARGS